MAINILSNSGKVEYNIKSLVADQFGDLPLEGIVAGSVAYVVADKQNYMFNSLGQWVTVSLGSSGGGAGKLEIVPLGEGEYDPETGKPTILDAQEGVIYLVPNTESGSSELYVEWINVHGEWEKFGSAAIELENYQEKLVSGTNIKTINNESILGEGNIIIKDNGLRYVDIIYNDSKFSTGDALFNYLNNERKKGEFILRIETPVGYTTDWFVNAWGDSYSFYVTKKDRLHTYRLDGLGWSDLGEVNFSGDLSNYYTKAHIDANYYTKTQSNSNYYTKTEVNTKVNAKQNTLISGNNIKSLMNKSLLGSGNIDVSWNDLQDRPFYEIPKGVVIFENQDIEGTVQGTTIEYPIQDYKDIITASFPKIGDVVTAYFDGNRYDFIVTNTNNTEWGISITVTSNSKSFNLVSWSMWSDMILSVPTTLVAQDSHLNKLVFGDETGQLVKIDKKFLPDESLSADFNVSIKDNLIYSKTEDYSYDKMPIGKWVDGRTIWRKVYKITDELAKDNLIKVDDTPNDMYELIKGYGIIQGTAAAGNGQSNSDILVYASEDGIFCKQNFTSYPKSLYIIIEYTEREYSIPSGEEPVPIG